MRLAAAIVAVAIASVASADPPASSDGVSLVGGAPDAGAATIWSACPEPDAGDVAQELDGGAWELSPARAAYDACKLAACESYASPLSQAQLAGADAGFTWQTSHTVATVTGVLSTLLTLYITDRQARHLSLWP